MLAISVGRKAGVYKDTAHNILDTGEYVIHIADTPLMRAVHESAVEHPADVSEVEHLGLETAPSELIKVPRLTAPPVAMECRFRQCLEFGEAKSRLIVGEVVMLHIRDGLVNDGKVDSAPSTVRILVEPKIIVDPNPPTPPSFCQQIGRAHV